jgi:hypothetical protein
MDVIATLHRTAWWCRLAVLLALSFVPSSRLAAQRSVDHAAHHPTGRVGTAMPTLAGQDAYGAIAEIVRILEADSTTDWSKVDIEALRQHLIDMSEVTLRSAVVQRPIEGGLEVEVTGQGRTRDAIRAMTSAHARELASYGIVARSDSIPGGARFTVVARDAGDARLVAKIRGLGFIGLMTVGDHHAAHHLALARGAGAAAHHEH